LPALSQQPAQFDWPHDVAEAQKPLALQKWLQHSSPAPQT
jgi:hypothetical protein